MGWENKRDSNDYYNSSKDQQMIDYSEVNAKVGITYILNGVAK